MFNGIRKTIRNGIDNFFGVNDWASVAKDQGPLNPADIRKNPKKYQDLVDKAKMKRKKSQSDSLLPMKTKKTSYLKKAVSSKMGEPESMA